MTTAEPGHTERPTATGSTDKLSGAHLDLCTGLGPREHSSWQHQQGATQSETDPAHQSRHSEASSCPELHEASACAQRKCCEDNSCSSSIGSAFSGHKSSSTSSCDTVCSASALPSVHEDTGIPRHDLQNADSSQLERLGTPRRGSGVDSLQLTGNVAAPAELDTSEPLLQDNDDRFCLFPIKYVFFVSRLMHEKRYTQSGPILQCMAYVRVLETCPYFAHQFHWSCFCPSCAHLVPTLMLQISFYL